MVDRIGGNNALAREAIQAALRSQAEQVDAVRSKLGGSESPVEAAENGADFANKLEQGIAAVDAEVQKAERLPEDLLTGKVDDFHEVAVQLKRAEFSFRFAMEIRNKLIDAYREVMRMNV